MSASRPATSKSPPQPLKVNQRSGSQPKVTDLLRWGRHTNRSGHCSIYLRETGQQYLHGVCCRQLAESGLLVKEQSCMPGRSALLGENPNPLTHLVCYGKSNDVSTHRSKHYVQNFLSYLQQQTDEGAINHPWSQIHVVEAGFFIVHFATFFEITI